jgi:DNA-binding transcriptional LysR family regulator
MKLSQLEYFLAASDRLNFTAAAKSIYVSQPALSKQIRLIEEELGVQLFHRSKKGVCLTEAGLRFKSDLEAVIKGLDRATQNARAAGKKLEGAIRIGCFQGAAVEDLIFSVSERYKEQFPEIGIVFMRGGFREIRQALLDGTVDIILTLDFEMTQLHACFSRVVLTAKSAFVYADKSPLAEKAALSKADFADLPFLVLSPDNSSGAYRNALTLTKKLGLGSRNIELYDSWETLLTYLKMGHGFTILFENVCHKMNGLRQYVIPGDDADRSVVAVWKNESALVEHFVNNLSLHS